MQADGICADRSGTFLFTEKDDRTKWINKKVDESGDILLTALLNVLNVETQFSAGISKADDRQKQLGPIGAEYYTGPKDTSTMGQRFDSLKAFSLLAFVVFVFVQIGIFRCLQGNHEAVGCAPDSLRWRLIQALFYFANIAYNL